MPEDEEIDYTKQPTRVTPHNLPPGHYIAERVSTEEVRVIRNADDLQRAIEEDELADAHEAAKDGIAKMSVIEYAKYKSRSTGTIVQPQLIYYYIRTGKIQQETCICGRKVIDVASADEYFAKRDAKDRSST